MALLDDPDLRKSHTRGKLAVLAVAIGVALFVSVEAVNSSVRAAFRSDAAALAGSGELTVVGGDTGFPDATIDVVRRTPGVHAAVPLIVARVRIEDHPVVLLGVDRRQRPLPALDHEDGVLLAPRFARDHGVTAGARVDVMTAFGTRPFVVRGVLPDDAIARSHGGNVALMDIDAARVVLGRRGQVDRIDVVPDAGVRGRELKARLETAVGEGVRVELPQQAADRSIQLVADYQGGMSVIAALALLVSMCLVAYTVAVSAAERRRELAIRRALGASRGRVAARLVGEAGLIGLIGGLLGVPLALLVGEALIEPVTTSMTFQYATPIHAPLLQFSAEHAIGAVAVSVLAAMIAALVPAVRAAQVRPAEAFTAAAAATERTALRLTPLAGTIALAALLAPLPAWLEALLAVVGAACVVPWLVERVVAGAAWVGQRPLFDRAPSARLAAESLTRDLRRSARSTLAVVVGLIFIVIAGAAQATLAAAIDEWEVRTLRSDVIVSSRGRIGALQVQPLSETLAAEIDAVPGVDIANGRGARAYRFVHHVHEGRPIAIKAMDPQHPRVGSAVFDVRDRPADDAMRELFTPGEPAVMVSENFVRTFGQKTGDTIAIDTPSGRTRFRVVGVIVEFANPNGVIYLDRSVYRAHWRDPLVTAFMVEAAPGVSRTTLRAALTAALGPRDLQPVLVDELREQTRQTLYEAFAAIRALQAAAFLVGLLGLTGALLVTLLDRVGDLGRLRVRGVAPAQIRRMLVIEATVLGAAGGTVAAALGAYVAPVWAVPRILESLGWRLGVPVSPLLLAITVATGVAVGLAAGIVSTRRVANREVWAWLDQRGA